MASLKNEIMILRESNIQLVHVTTSNKPMWSNIAQNNNNPSNNKPIRTDKNLMKEHQSYGIADKTNEKKPTDNKNTAEVGQKQRGIQGEREKKQATSTSKQGEMEDEQQNEEGQWEYSRAQRRQTMRRQNIIYRKLKDNTIFNGVTKYVDYHVFNCDLDLTAEELNKYLTESVKIPKIICEQMHAKHPKKYTSFKISVPVNYVDQFKNPDIWPEYVCINRFENRFLRQNAPESKEGSE